LTRDGPDEMLLTMSNVSPESPHGPLPAIQFQTLNAPVLTFLGPAGRRDHDVSAPYQRGSVWTPAQRVALIRSLLMNIPIGAIYRAKFMVPQQGEYFRIVDGKQRLEAIWAFVDGAISVPADWFDPRQIDPARVVGGQISYAGFSDYGRRMFDMRTIAVLDFVSDRETVEVAPGAGTVGNANQFIHRRRTPGEAIAYEAMVYGLINSAGSAQTPEGLAAARRIAAGSGR
jgi:hypothetical protein